MGEVVPLNPSQLATQLEEFFDFLFKDQEGFVYSPTKNPVTDVFEQYYFAWPTEKKALIDHVNRYSSTHEVYYGPALFSARDATKKSFLGSNVVWAEFDGVLPISLNNVPEPSIKIQSSTEGHEHWYWKLEGFCRDMALLEDISQRLAYELKADLSCWNANRVLRPPGTLHHESARQVRVQRWDPRSIPMTEFVNISKLPIKLLGIGDINAVPPTLEILLKYPFPSDAAELFKQRHMPKGSRSSALTKVAHCCMEMGMTDAETLSVLYNRDEVWGKFKNRKDRKERLLGIINYTRAYHPVGQVAPSVGKDIVFRYYVRKAFMSTDIKIEWTIPNLIHNQGIICVAGQPKVGKTQMSLRFAERLAKGEKYLIWDIPKPMKTIFISMEMAHGALKYFIETMDMKDNDLLNNNMLIMPIGFGLKLSNRHVQQGLNEAIEEAQPDGIIIDSYGLAVSDNLSDDKVTMQTFDYIQRKLRGEYGLFTWFIHHPRKEQIGNKKPKRLDDLHGSAIFTRMIDTGILLWEEGQDIEVSCLKLRMAKEFESFRIRRTANLDFRMMKGQSHGFDTIGDVTPNGLSI